MRIKALAAAVLLFTALFGGRAYGAERPLTLWIAADLHYISPRLTDNGPCFMRVVENADGKFMEASEELAEGLVREVIEKHPDGLILLGDLTFNGARESHEDLVRKLRRIEEAGVPVYVIPGNHDIACTQAARFHGDSFERVESISQEEFVRLYGDFGYGEALLKDEGSFSYLADVGGENRFLFIDVNTEAAPGFITKEALSFAEEALEEAAGKRVFAASHQNLFPHNILFSDGFAIAGGGALLELYRKAGVPANFSGHTHMQNISVPEKGPVDVTTGALATYPFYAGVLEIGPSGASYEVHTVAGSEENPLPESIPVEGRIFLWKNALRQMGGGGDLPEEMAAFAAKASVLYLAGRRDMIPWQERYEGEPVYDRWQRQASLVSVYLWSLRDEGPGDDRTWTWEWE